MKPTVGKITLILFAGFFIGFLFTGSPLLCVLSSAMIPAAVFNN